MVQMIKPPVVDGKCTLTLSSEISFFENMVDDVNLVLQFKENCSSASFSSLELFAIMVLQSADCLTGLDLD